MGFFRQIHENYGYEASNLLKLWMKVNTSLASTQNRKCFLISCKKKKIYPRHVYQNINTQHIDLPTHHVGQADDINCRLRTKIINLEIGFCFSHIHHLEYKRRQFKRRLLEILPHNIVGNFESRLVHKYNKEFSEINKRLNKKLNNLVSKKKSTLVIQDHWLKNLSNKSLPDDVKTILSLGPKFAFPPSNKDISMKHLLAEVEEVVVTAPSNMQNILRAKATNAVTNYIKKNENTRDILSEMQQKTKSFIRGNPDMIITKSDKGNVTVVMNRGEYENRVAEMVSDSDVYKVLDRDPTSKLQTQNNDIVKALKTRGYLNEKTARQLTTYRAIAPRFYGLPKVHKENTPIRPIVSTINSPTSALSKWIANILKVSFKEFNSFSVDDSFVFSEKINEFQLPEDFVLISLDVVSLFTNISLDLTLHIIQEEWPLIEMHTDVPIENFVQIIEFLFEANYFKCGGVCYSMVFGCPMGSSLSPILANIVMSALIKSSLQRLSFTPPFLYQYVDDIITAVPANRVAEILSIFNDFDEHLKFTVEEEDNRSVPFLDTRVIRQQNNSIILDWYQKKSSSGRYVHFHSYHDISMKTNVIRAMINRVEKITHSTLRKDAVMKLKNIFIKNGYPKVFLNRIFHNRGSSAIARVPDPVVAEVPPNENVPPDIEDNVTPEIGFFKLPYIKDLTSKLINILKYSENVLFARHNIATNHVNFSSLKDKLPTLLKSDVVYEIPCSSCNQKYIGQCSTSLKQRVALHRSDITLRPGRCTLAQHAIMDGHDIDFDNIRILTQERKYRTRTFLEMCYINQCPNPINSKSDIDNLSVIYSALLLHDFPARGNE